MSVQSTQASPTFLEYYIGKWRDLNQKAGDASLQELSLRSERESAYSEIGYWDGLVNNLPGFISSSVASDYEALNRYNRVSRDVQVLGAQVNQLEEGKGALIAQIFDHVINSPDSAQAVKAMKHLLNQLLELDPFSQNILSCLQKAKNSEWWDGHTSDHNFFGAMNDFESKRDNMRAAHLLYDLNNLIRRYNGALSATHYSVDIATCNIRPLQELYGAGESIMDAELNESNPFYRLTWGVGDWWSSCNTLNVIKRVEASVQNLTFEIRNQIDVLQRKIDSFVIETLSKDHPDFVMEAGMTPRFSL